MLGETGAPRFSHLVVTSTSSHVLLPQVVYFSLRFMSLIVSYLFSLTLSLFSDSWGLVNKLDNDPLLKVETALVNVSICQDLLLPTSLIGSRLVDVATGMDNKILSAMSRKHARVSGDSSSAPSPQKKSNIGPSKTPAPACLLLRPEKMAERSLERKVLRATLRLGIELYYPRLGTGAITWPYIKGTTSSQWSPNWLKMLTA